MSSSSSIAKRPNGKYRARYRDDADKEHARHFDRKVDAQRWLDEVTAARVTGTYVDPAAGKITLAKFYEDWAARQVWESTTAHVMGIAVAGCTFADVPLASVRRSHVEAWVKSMTADGLAPGTVRGRFAHVRSVLRGAVADRIIAFDPAVGVRLPALPRRDATWELPTGKQVAALLGAATDGYAAAVGLAAFAGLRAAEIGGLQVGDVDFLRGVVHVRRQVQHGAKGKPAEVRAPKYGSARDVAIPQGLVDRLAAHVAEYRPGDDPTRWLVEDVALTPGMMTRRWHRTATAANIPRIEVDEGKRAGWVLTMHDLRHYYASGLIAAGCDVVTVQRALGHAKATTTLNTYSHMWPSAEDRTRGAAGAMLADVLKVADSLRTGQAATPS
jgi:integrase